MIYQKQYTTRWHDTDAARLLRPSAMLTYFEETGDLHVRSLGRSLDQVRDESGMALILARMSMVFHKPVTADQSMTVETWTCEGRSFSTGRDFRATVAGECVAEATSMWAVLDVNTHRPVRTADFPIEFCHEDTLALDIPARVAIPKTAEMEKVGERRISYSDIDYNMHMNNTRYPDMLCDFMPDMRGVRMRWVTLSFLHEAALGHTLTVYRAREGDRWFFRTLDGDTVCLEAVLGVEANELLPPTH